MKRLRPIPHALALLLLLPIFAAAQVQPQERTVVQPVLNLYSTPTTDAAVVSQAIYATVVVVLDEKDGWARVRTPDAYTGWVEACALADRGDHTYGALPSAVQVRSLFAHVYREASVTKHAPLLTVPFETRLEPDVAAETVDGWTAVRLPDQRRGFVQNGDLARTSAPLGIDDTIALARRFLGVPYTWGGTSSYGYDCSGFMQMLMRQRGYQMPRDSGPQARWDGLVPVETADLKPGDLLYFGASEQRITHTGMFIGNGQFINATTHETPMVRIDNLSEPHWTRLLVAARRVKP